MAHELFSEIDKFEAWARMLLSEPSKISAEWETDYPDWPSLDEQFRDFVSSVPPSTWSTHEMGRLSYIIARDVEDGRCMELLSDDALVSLAEYALNNGEKHTRWQMALELPRLVDKEKAIALIERYANDPDVEVQEMAARALAAAIRGDVVSYKDIIGGT